jgi:hypothetical protein
MNMQKKIKELAEQARAKVRSEWDIGNNIPYPEAHYKFQNDNDQKLAELIVQECIDAIGYHMNAYGDSLYEEGIHEGMAESIRLIENIFGIE